MLPRQPQKKGFTLIELLVTVSIMVILMTIAVASFTTTREQARDAQRKTDLRTVEAALALYKNKYGLYPEACNGPTTANTPRFSGQLDADFDCTSGSVQYIVGLAPEFIPKLPVDLKLNGTDSGYVYAVNNERTVYKFMALNTVETEEVERGDEFSRCDPSWDLPFVSFANSYEDVRLCIQTPAVLNQPGFGPTAVCLNSSTEYQTSYSVSAGFSSDRRGQSTPERAQEFDTEAIRCG